MSATLTAICQHPDCDNEYVPKPYMTTHFCCPECGQDAYRRRNRGESAAIAHDPDRENKPARTSKMTAAEFRKELVAMRRYLDDKPARAGDRYWGRLAVYAAHAQQNGVSGAEARKWAADTYLDGSEALTRNGDAA